MKILIVRFLTGNCTTGEKTLLFDWLNESKDNLKLFEEVQTVWQSASTSPVIDKFNVDTAWKSVNRRISEIEKPVQVSALRSINNKSRPVIFLARIAAAVVFILATTWFIQMQTQPRLQTFATEITVSEPIVLADGTRVTLNAGSTITYPDRFNGDQRVITLQGEAYFEVAPNPSKPFIISMNDIGVKVLGTSFNLKAPDDQATIELCVNSGEVLFYRNDVNTGKTVDQIQLGAGSKGIFNRNKQMFSTIFLQNENYMGWKSGILTFTNTPLPEVFPLLESTYGISIDITCPYEHLALTARFEQEQTENILETLRLIFGFHIEQQGNNIHIF